MVAVAIFVGPERTPLRLDHRVTEAAVFGAYHCHAIVPRALLGCDPGGLPWRLAAPVIEDAVTGRISVPVDHPAAPWVEAATAGGVVPLRAAAQLVVQTATRLAGACGADAIDAWLVKEGHTASVWQLRAADGTTWCVNVARDAVAADELERSGRLLVAWHARAPHRVARIDEVVRERVDVAAGAIETVVAIGEWVNGVELHLPVSPGSRLVAVGWFATDDVDALGTTRQHVFGRWLDDAEEAATWSAIADATAELADRAGDDGWVVPAFHLNEGDWVLTDAGPVLVAADAAGCPIARVTSGGADHDLAHVHAPTWHRVLARLAAA